jgi:hypothetical protein
MKNFLLVTLVLVVFVSSSGCASFSEEQRSKYDILGSSVSASSYAVIGEFADAIPPDFTVDKFMQLIEKNIPENYYKALKKYSLDIKPKGSYYLLLVIDPKTNNLILFDYSCTPEPDGLVLLNPDKYDLNNLDLYDTCKAQTW